MPQLAPQQRHAACVAQRLSCLLTSVACAAVCRHAQAVCSKCPAGQQRRLRTKSQRKNDECDVCSAARSHGASQLQTRSIGTQTIRQRQRKAFYTLSRSQRFALPRCLLHGSAAFSLHYYLLFTLRHRWRRRGRRLYKAWSHFPEQSRLDGVLCSSHC